MKIILSRKGFDCKYGGYPSPILPDGRIVSFPVPGSGDDRYLKLMLRREKSYLDLMEELNIIGFDNRSYCHLDPDIYYSVKKRCKNWRGAFGQANQAYTHLNNQSVHEDDLFLFFGWFRFTEKTNGKLKFVGPNMHVIFGYLQIDKIYNCDNFEEIPDWLREHPHYKWRKLANNVIYSAKEVFSVDHNFLGYGTFQYNEKLKLTKDGYTRSCWNLPEIFNDLKISYHNNKSWRKDYFKSAEIGQEFVVEENKEVMKWAYMLIQNYS